jgi:hypothetical protein
LYVAKPVSILCSRDCAHFSIYKSNCMICVFDPAMVSAMEICTFLHPRSLAVLQVKWELLEKEAIAGQ